MTSSTPTNLRDNSFAHDGGRAEPAPVNALNPKRENPFAGMSAERLHDYVQAANLRVPFWGISLRGLDSLDEFLPGWRATVTVEDYVAAIRSDKEIYRDVVSDIWEYHHQETFVPELPSQEELLEMLPFFLDFLEA